MKKILLILISVLFLTACGGGDTENIVSGLDDPAKPRIPIRRPTFPDQEKFQANALDKLRDSNSISNLNMGRLIDTINENVSQPNITIQDIERGWYLGGENDKKDGTPSTWAWFDKGVDSAWISPSSLDKIDDNNLDKLCRSTAGTYAFSCIEREFPGCEHIANSLCRCSDQTNWIEKQGCIFLNKDLKPIAISPSDLDRGWYYGLPNEKKLNTPTNWVWMEGGQKSRWQTPSPTNGD